MGLIQARTRLEDVTVEAVELDNENAFLIASANRLDWMNRRAALVDQWRLIEFNANRLKSAVDVAVDGDVGTLGDNPVKFRGPTGSLRARLIFDAPLNRKSERNLYRESLIEYQRAKRSYIQYEDSIRLRLRSRLRDMERLRKNLEIQRRALIIAIRRVDLSIEDLNEPIAPPLPGEAPAQLGPTLAQNLLRALSDFRNTQDNLLSVWFNYHAQRMALMFDLGIMRIDENGKWIDEPLDVALAQCGALIEPELLPDEGYEDATLDEIIEELSEEDPTGDVHAAVDAEAEEASANESDPAKSFEQTAPAKRRFSVPLPALLKRLKPAKRNVQVTANSDHGAAILASWTGAVERGIENSAPSPVMLASATDREEPVDPIAKLQFVNHLIEFKHLRDQGASNEVIAKETGWSMPEVKAYEQALGHISDAIVQDIDVSPRPLTAPPQPHGIADPEPVDLPRPEAAPAASRRRYEKRYR